MSSSCSVLELSASFCIVQIENVFGVLLELCQATNLICSTHIHRVHCPLAIYLELFRNPHLQNPKHFFCLNSANCMIQIYSCGNGPQTFLSNCLGYADDLSVLWHCGYGKIKFKIVKDSKHRTHTLCSIRRLIQNSFHSTEIHVVQSYFE